MKKKARPCLSLLVLPVLFFASVGGGCAAGDSSSGPTGGGTNNPEASEAIGILDTSFGSPGKVSTNLAPNSEDKSYGVLYQSDQKIIVLGQAQISAPSTDNNDVVMVRYLPNGDLDTSFGTGGTVVIPIGTVDDVAWGGNIDSNNKIVIVGSTLISGSNNYSAFICRYNTDGTPDNSFSSDGKVLISVTGNQDKLTEVEFDSAGKIVAAGYSQKPNADWNSLVVRYNDDGTPDNTFDEDGVRVDNFGLGIQQIYWDVAIQSDDKIVCCGYMWMGTHKDMLAVRYNSNGTPDPTFDSDGWKTIDFPLSFDSAYDVQIQPADQKIILAGYQATYNAGWTEILSATCLLVRLDPDGSPDSTFDQDGISTPDIGKDIRINSATLRSDGKILIVGETELVDPNAPFGKNMEFLVAQVNTEGELDTGFNNTGSITTGFGVLYDRAACIVLQSDGKILVSGCTDSGTDLDFALMRFTSGGELDTTFGFAGYQKVSIGDGTDQALAAATTSDGSIILAGKSSVSMDDYLSLAKFTPEGLVDGTFGINGKSSLNLGTGNDAIQSIGIQSNGMIVVCGAAHNGSNDDLLLARFDSDGNLDYGFGNISETPGYYMLNHALADKGWAMKIMSDDKILIAGETAKDWLIARFTENGIPDPTFTDGLAAGLVRINFAGEVDIAYDLAIQPDGKIVVAGMRSSGSISDTTVIRLLPNGALDQSGFGTNGVTVISVSAGFDEARAVALQANGQIVLGGLAQNLGSGYFDTFVARLDATGALDTSGFGSPNGYVTASWGTENATIFDLAVHSNQKILVTGYGETSSAEALYLGRFLSNGTEDSTFQGGTVSYSTGFTNLQVHTMLPQEDGKIILAGYGNTGAGSDEFVVLRFK